MAADWQLIAINYLVRGRSPRRSDEVEIRTIYQVTGRADRNLGELRKVQMRTHIGRPLSGQ